VPRREGNENRLQWRWWCSTGGRSDASRRSLAYPGLRGATQLYNARSRWRRSRPWRQVAGDHAGDPARADRNRVGRPFQVVPGKPAIVLDVGHNPQAIKVLADNLASMGFFDRTYAVVGMLNDKDIVGALSP
jgi:dihydrofolate synthase/folylpolyglutamate synthase